MENKIEEENEFIFEKEKNFDFNDLVEKMGYQSIHFKIIISCILMYTVEGSSLTLISTFVIPLEKTFALDKIMILILSSFIFAGAGIGSISIGLLSRYFARIDLIRFSIICFLILSILKIFCFNIILFTFVSFLMSFCLGVSNVLILNILFELLPMRFRPFFSVFIWSGFPIGLFFNYIFALVLDKNFEPDKIGSILVATTIFYLILIAPCLIMITETHRNLIIKGHDREAFYLLEEMLEKVNIKLTIVLKDQIKKSIKTSDNIEFKPNFKSLFSKNHFFISIVSSFIFAISSALMYGPLLIYSKTLNDLHISDNQNIIKSGIILSIGGVLSLILAGLISNSFSIGLKAMSIILFIISWFFTLAIVIWTDYIQYLFVVFYSIINVCSNSITSMIILLYPTIIRDLASGYLIFCFRFGQFFSQLTFLGTFYIGIKVPYIILCALNAVIVVLIFLIKIDSTAIPLDHCFEYQNTEINHDDEEDHKNKIDKNE